MQEVQATNVKQLNIRQDAKCPDDACMLVVHDKRAVTLEMTAAPHLILAGAELVRVGFFHDICVGVLGLEERDAGSGSL